MDFNRITIHFCGIHEILFYRGSSYFIWFGFHITMKESHVLSVSFGFHEEIVELMPGQCNISQFLVSNK